MIDYATWCAIRDGAAQHLTAPQLAQSLGLDVKTVRHWLGRPYQPRAKVQRPSKLDPFKGRIVAWLDAHPTGGGAGAIGPGATTAQPSEQHEQGQAHRIR